MSSVTFVAPPLFAIGKQLFHGKGRKYILAVITSLAITLPVFFPAQCYLHISRHLFEQNTEAPSHPKK